VWTALKADTAGRMAVTGSAGFKRKGDRVKRSLILRSA
jgi:hypothetical protein